jgi:long-chain acyl-CoA synthetase
MGGAKLDDNSKRFYDDNKILVCEGYGSSELSPLVSVNHLNNPRDLNSIGKILDGVIVEIINDEICVSGPNVMKGYWNLDNLNKQIFHEKNNKKFYKTGDSGYIKNDFLFYNGRISDNYKMSNGKFVNVNFVENKIKKVILNNFIIYGENMDYNVLIVEKSDKKYDNSTIIKLNNELENFINIKKIIEIDSSDMVNFLTPKMSIKRKALINFVKNNNYL